MAQSTTGEKCQSPVFVIFMSENLSTNLCCNLHVQRVNLSYHGEISLHFDLPSLYSCRIWSPLPRAVNYNSRMRAIWIQLDSSNYSTFLSFLGIEEEAGLIIDDEVRD